MPSLPPSLSLAIIMVEMLTHESPFYEYLDYVEIDEVLDAIAGRKKLSMQLPQVRVCQGRREEEKKLMSGEGVGERREVERAIS